MGKALKLAKLLTDNDQNHNCPFCKKKEWGEDLHEYDCPFSLAYDIVNKAKEATDGK